MRQLLGEASARALYAHSLIHGIGSARLIRSRTMPRSDAIHLFTTALLDILAHSPSAAAAMADDDGLFDRVRRSVAPTTSQ